MQKVGDHFFLMSIKVLQKPSRPPPSPPPSSTLFCLQKVSELQYKKSHVDCFGPQNTDCSLFLMILDEIGREFGACGHIENVYKTVLDPKILIFHYF